jgi:hypothetical protein
MERFAMRKKSFAFGVALAAIAGFGLAVPAVSPANAAPITGALSITGNDVTNESNHTIAFVAGTSVINNFSNSGSFATVFGNSMPNTPIVMIDESTTPLPPTPPFPGLVFVDYTVAANFVGKDLFTGPSGLALLISTFSATEDLAKNTLTFNGTGTLTLNGFDPTVGAFTVTTQIGTGAISSTTFSATAAVPGPVVGAGLPGLIAACGGLLAFARRRRRQQYA